MTSHVECASDIGPSIRAVPIDKGSETVPRRLLDAAQRRRLAALATPMIVGAHTFVYRQAADGEWVFSRAEAS